MGTSDCTISMKLLVDTKSQRVLFAEAGKDFVDFLFSLMCLPMGTVVRLVSKTEMAGSLVDVYNSIENMSGTYFQPNFDKNTLLEPKAIRIDAATPLILASAESNRDAYTCTKECFRISKRYGDVEDSGRRFYSLEAGVKCPDCRTIMSKEMTYIAPPAPGLQEGSSIGEGGYVKSVVSYMITDELQVKPLSTISSITLLNKLNVKELTNLEEKMVSIGMTEGLELLKESLKSRTVLTNVFLKREMTVQEPEQKPTAKMTVD